MTDHFPQLYRDETPTLSASLRDQGIVYALGSFDGVHRGHQAVLRAALTLAREKNSLAGVFSFSTHPKTRLQNGATFNVLASFDEKIRLLQQAGMQVMVLPPFTQAMREMPRERFIGAFLKRQLGASAVVVGHDFHFGYQRQGNVAWLAAHASDFNLGIRVVSAVQSDAETPPISSTWIRQSLRDGNVAQAAELLGRPYSIQANAQPGRQLGRTLGVPTINLHPQHPEQLLPKQGVYVASLWAEQRWWPVVLNFGTAPTIDQTPAPACFEAHILTRFPYEHWVGQPRNPGLASALARRNPF